MKKQIIINSTLDEVRIAITEDEQLAELFIDMPDKHRSIGNIYLGRVNNIVQSLNAAFINIGLKQDAFLHFSDIDESLENVITEEDEDIFDLSSNDSKPELLKVDKKLNKANKRQERIIKSDIIFTLLARMQEKAYFFNKTGGVHNCGLADREGCLLLYCEDVSRYNTIDRIFGEALLKNISMKDKILLTSCRITSGIMEKIINGGITTIASRSAVTDSAAKLANRKNITLIGFARDNRMNIYSCSDNVVD